MITHKKNIAIFVGIIVLILIFMLVFKYRLKNNISPLNENNNIVSNVDLSSTSYNGWLHTNGSALENEKGQKIQLRGVSSHGINWFYDIITYENLKYLKETWNINVFRIANYTYVNTDGYVNYPGNIQEKIDEIVKFAVDLDMYVVIDWHTLEDKNPQQFQNEAIKFFDEMSKKYANIPNVIYEICNEPNSKEVTWDNNVKPYAESVIPVIRNNSPKSLIIVGTPLWCTDITSAANNPLNYPNIVYSCHFYSGTHRNVLRNKILECVEKNIPIFVSECGVTNATGNGNVYFDEFRNWINFLNENNISWIYWSFSNKAESSSIISSKYNNNSSNMDNIDSNSSNNKDNNDKNDIDKNLTMTGTFIKEIFQSYKK